MGRRDSGVGDQGPNVETCGGEGGGCHSDLRPSKDTTLQPGVPLSVLGRQQKDPARPGDPCKNWMILNSAGFCLGEVCTGTPDASCTLAYCDNKNCQAWWCTPMIPAP